MDDAPIPPPRAMQRGHFQVIGEFVARFWKSTQVRHHHIWCGSFRALLSKLLPRSKVTRIYLVVEMGTHPYPVFCGFEQNSSSF